MLLVASPTHGARAGMVLRQKPMRIRAHPAQAAKIDVEPYWPGLFAKLFAKKKMDDLITNVGAGAGSCFCALSETHAGFRVTAWLILLTSLCLAMQ